MSEFSGYDFTAGSVRGLRAFKVDSLGRLTGWSFKAVWTPGENVAECRQKDSGWGWVPPFLGGTITLTTDPTSTRRWYAAGGVPTTYTVKDAPAIEPPAEPAENPPHDLATCQCGFYAYYEGSNDYAVNKGTVSAVVEGYGKTVIGSRGFRCEKAKIIALHLPSGTKAKVPAHLLERVRSNYPNVPVFAKRKAMLAEFPLDASIAPTPETDPDFWTRDAS